MAKKDFRPKAASLLLAVKFVDEQTPTRSQLPIAIKAAAKRYHVAQWLVKRFYNHKKRSNEKWDFFQTNAGHLVYIYNNRETLKVHQRIWIVEYRDFFIFRYSGQVFRKDGFGVRVDRSGRRYIKDFQGRVHAPEKLIYAGGKDPRFVLSYQHMKKVTIEYNDNDKNNLKASNLFAKNDNWSQL